MIDFLEVNNMYYVPDGTEMCGYYECKDCGSRFLDVKIGPQIVCPYCGEEPDMEMHTLFIWTYFCRGSITQVCSLVFVS